MMGKKGNSTSQMNTRFVVGLLAIIGVTVYCIYSAWNSGSKPLQKDDTGNIQDESKPVKTSKTSGDGKVQKLLKSWKTTSFGQIDIPATVTETMKSISISERYLEFTPKNGEKVKVFYRECGPADSKLQILLLHGAAFSSKNWQEIKTLQLIGAMGHRVVAIDLPGKGKCANVKVPTKKDDFLASFIQEMKLQKPVVVSPSMSGSYAIPYIFMKDAKSCSERVSGFIPVAPAGTNVVKKETYAQCQVPTMIVYGTKDRGGELVSQDVLLTMPNSEIFPLKDAPHPAYMVKTDEWHKLVYSFLNLL